MQTCHNLWGSVTSSLSTFDREHVPVEDRYMNHTGDPCMNHIGDPYTKHTWNPMWDHTKFSRNEICRVTATWLKFHPLGSNTCRYTRSLITPPCKTYSKRKAWLVKLIQLHIQTCHNLWSFVTSSLFTFDRQHDSLILFFIFFIQTIVAAIFLWRA